MKNKKQIFLFLGLLILIVFFLFSLWKPAQDRIRDFQKVKESGVLRIVTEYNSVGYYISGDTICGSQYELCKFIEKTSGLTIEIQVENNLEKCVQGLKKGKYDVIALNIPITSENRLFLSFTDPILLSKQVLVQRKPEFNQNKPLIKNQIELGKKVVYLSQNSPNKLRLQNMSEEIADTIYIREEKLYNSEQLIYMVAQGDIDYAVVEKELAQNNLEKFPQIDINTDISFTQLNAWAVNKKSPVLLDSLNAWIKRRK